MRYSKLIDPPWNAQLALTTAPTVEPVTLAELQAHARVDDSEVDAYLTALIAGARQWVEEWLQRQLVTATWTLTLDCFPRDGIIELPRPPLLAVTTVNYYDVDRATQLLAAATYHVHAHTGPEASAFD